MLSPKISIKLSIFFTGFAGIVAEYLLSTLASYLLGDSIFQWTMTISIMLLAMGVGARFSKYIKDPMLFNALIYTEISISLLVSFSVYIAYLQAPYESRMTYTIYSLCFLIGFLIGLEIPLAVRINELFEELKENISTILEKDYLGALPGGILYGYFFLPKLGLLYTPVLVGSLNLMVAGLLLFSFPKRVKKHMIFLYLGTICCIAFFTFFAKPIYLYLEQRFYRDPIVEIKQTKYQKIVITKWRNDYLLYLDGHLQLNTVDEKRYHETIVHIPMSLVNAQNILVIGGGDGCVVRELLKYPYVKNIFLVDLDKEFVNFSMQNKIMRKINQNSLLNKKVKLFFQDGFNFVKDFKKNIKSDIDLVIVDLPDPRNIRSSRLYSLEFYKIIYRVLSENGVIITQATTPFFAKKAFCCILNTIKSAHFYAYPLIINVPSFGEWGFVIGLKSFLSKSSVQKSVYRNLNENYTKFLTKGLAASFFETPKDLVCNGVKINTLVNPVILKYYDDSFWDLL